jgi:hypothetical protein
VRTAASKTGGFTISGGSHFRRGDRKKAGIGTFTNILYHAKYFTTSWNRLVAPAWLAARGSNRSVTVAAL